MVKVVTMNFWHDFLFLMFKLIIAKEKQDP